MFRLLFLATMVLVFTGCSSKQEQDLLNSYTNKMEYHKNLQQTESKEIKIEDKRVAMITATYMFRSTEEKNDTRDEVFYIAVDFEEENASIDFNKQKSALLSESNATEENATIVENDVAGRKQTSNSYSLTINGKKAIKVERMPDGDERLKRLSFLTGWSKYYKVTFKNIKSTMFTLSFKNETVIADANSTALLKFSKVGKFVYTKEGF